jgi:hypothetical protein
MENKVGKLLKRAKTVERLVTDCEKRSGCGTNKDGAKTTVFAPKTKGTAVE